MTERYYILEQASKVIEEVDELISLCNKGTQEDSDLNNEYKRKLLRCCSDAVDFKIAIFNITEN